MKTPLPLAKHWAHVIPNLAVLMLLGLICSPPVQADVVSDWVGLADRALDGRALPPPLQTERERTAPALTALALFEAVNAVDRRYQSYLDIPRANVPASEEAAAIAAGYTILSALYPERHEALDDARSTALAHISTSASREAGLAVGKSAAQAALAHTMFAGAKALPYRPAGEVGKFVNPEPPLIAPWSLRAQFFFLKSPEETMPPPPPGLASTRYARDLNEVRSLGGVGQSGATPDTLRTARFLAGFSLDPILRRAAQNQPRLVDSARLWALVRMAQHDANAMISMAKMRYGTWRPINAIRNADRDGNAQTERDPNWTPVMPTPNHPEYPCGHCTMSSLMAHLLSTHFNGTIEVGSESAPLSVAMHFADWEAFLKAASLARIQGGMHFRFSNEAGQELGKAISTIAKTRFALPINQLIAH